MHTGQALDLVSRYDSLRNPLTSLGELAEQLIEQTGDNTLTLMDKGYYSLGLLNAWSLAGEHR
ncbi:hypothetical protein C3U82_005294, partial [Escherichia coli]|nr:hypothetical protein [Escherichia coli]EHF0883127.1 hypothetical protein [Escherichia coli]